MSKVDFYILDADSGQKSLLFACQLIEKFHQEQQRIFIYTATKDEAERLDALLWTYSDNSFIPHAIYNQQDDCAPSIQIGYSDAPEAHNGILINLSRSIPIFYSQFKHVIEIIFSDPQVQQLGRERYKQYRDQGCELNTLKQKV